jgi:hypothetical protein
MVANAGNSRMDGNEPPYGKICGQLDAGAGKTGRADVDAIIVP